MTNNNKNIKKNWRRQKGRNDWKGFFFLLGYIFLFSLSFPLPENSTNQEKKTETCVFIHIWREWVGEESALGGVRVRVCGESKERGWEKYGELIWLVAGWDDGQSELSGGAAWWRNAADPRKQRQQLKMRRDV